MEQAQLLQLLTNLRSADNDIRKASEMEYEGILQSNGVWLMCGLVEISATVEDQATVMMGLILLRKIFNSKENYFHMANAETQGVVKGRMLQILGSAAFGAQRSSAAACVSALTVKMNCADEEWGELWESIFQILENPSSDHHLRTICCEIISTIGPAMTDYFDKQSDRIVRSLLQCLNDPSLEAKRAAFQCVMSIAPGKLSSSLAVLIKPMLGVVQDRLNAGDWDSAETLIAKVAEGVSDFPQLFKNDTYALLEGMMHVASTPTVAEGARHMAIEVLLSYCESEPKTVRKVPDFTVAFFELLFQYTLSPDFKDDWDVSSCLPDEDDLEDAGDQVIGSTALDRLATALGGRKLETVAQRLFLENVRSAEWQRRNAALLLIAYVTEGMVRVLGSHLTRIVEAVLPALRDEVKYVRASALDCLTQLSVDFAPTIQEELHQSIVPAVVESLKDPIPAVATRAARCLDSFFDHCEDDDGCEVSNLHDFERYVHDVCVTIVSMLKQTPHQFIREDCLGALSSLISTCKEQLIPFVSNLVPVFQEVLAFPDTKETMPMKCKAIECTTLLACGVGKEHFMAYSHDVCNYLRDLLASGLENDDMRLRYVLRGWTCMVECLKGDVLPYMEVLMPVLISMMELECDAVVENAEVGEDSDDDDGDKKDIETCRVIIPGVGVKKFKFHTSLIEDKDLASSVATAILTELKGSLGPHLPLIAYSAIKLLRFQADASIRESGALILDGVLDAYTDAPDQRAAIGAHALPTLLECFEDEDDLDVSSAFAEVIGHCIDSAPSAVTPETVSVTSDRVMGVLQRAIERRTESLRKQQQETDEDEVDQLQAECEEAESLISDTCGLIDKLIERAGAVFAPVFIGKFFPVLEQWLSPSADNFLVRRGLSVLCSFIEFTPDHVAQFLPIIMQSALFFARSRDDADLLQANFYLIKVLLKSLADRNAQTPYQQFALDAINIFKTYISTPAAKKPDYIDCSCNAISIAVTFLTSYHQMLPETESSEVLNCVVACLPAGGDDIEASRIHESVLLWVTQGHPLLQDSPAASMEIVGRLKTAEKDMLNEATQQQLAAM